MNQTEVMERFSEVLQLRLREWSTRNDEWVVEEAELGEENVEAVHAALVEPWGRKVLMETLRDHPDAAWPLADLAFDALAVGRSRQDKEQKLRDLKEAGDSVWLPSSAWQSFVVEWCKLLDA